MCPSALVTILILSSPRIVNHLPDVAANCSEDAAIIFAIFRTILRFFFFRLLANYKYCDTNDAAQTDDLFGDLTKKLAKWISDKIIYKQLWLKFSKNFIKHAVCLHNRQASSRLRNKIFIDYFKSTITFITWGSLIITWPFTITI